MAARTRQSVAQIAQQIYDLLEPLESDERQRVIAGTMAMLGESQTPTGSAGGSSGGENFSSGDPDGRRSNDGEFSNIREFFDHKAPQTKIEQLAVIARYREQYEDKHEHTKDDFATGFKDARRNFDSKNYPRDMENAKVKGLFNRGSENTLAYYGQEYVDALPDRDAVNALKPPRIGAGGLRKKQLVRKHRLRREHLRKRVPDLLGSWKSMRRNVGTK